jgi:hypothetical protein
MDKPKQYQEVELDPFITNCPGQRVRARVISAGEEQSYCQMLTPCQGCDCLSSGGFIKNKYLKEVSNG